MNYAKKLDLLLAARCLMTIGGEVIESGDATYLSIPPDIAVLLLEAIKYIEKGGDVNEE